MNAIIQKESQDRVITIAARGLRVHPRAQRELVPSRLKKLRADMDLDAIGIIHAVEYEIGGVLALWVVDGHHRTKTLVDLGLGDWMVQVLVHSGVTDNRRAHELFLKLNDRTTVAPFDKFDNQTQAGYPSAVGATEVLERRGIGIRRSSGDGHVCCVSAINKTYAIDSGLALGCALDAIVIAWGSVASALEGKIIEGLGMVYGVHAGSINQAAMVKKLAKFPGGASGLLGKAKAMKAYRKSPLPRCIAELVIECYNTGRSVGRLDPI